MEFACFWCDTPNYAKFHATGDNIVIRNFRIGRIPIAAVVLLGAVSGGAHASVHRADFPGRDHSGRFMMAPASRPAPAPVAHEERSNESALQDQPAASPDAVPGPGCETSNPGSTPYCVDPGLLKSRGQ